jgi:dynein heavy chain
MKTFDANMKISDDKLTEFFSNRLQNNFHIILCMSKTGDNLRNYSRMYPGLVNNTTIVWFLGWPREALIEVANKYLKETDLEAEL